MHSGHVSGNDDTEQDVDRDWVNEDDAVLGEGGGGLGQKTKEAAVSNHNQVPKEAIFFMIGALARRRNRGLCHPC